MLARSWLLLGGAWFVAVACASSSDERTSSLEAGPGGRASSAPTGDAGAPSNPSASASRGGRAPSDGEAVSAGNLGEEPAAGGATGVIPAGGLDGEEALVDAEGPCALDGAPQAKLIVKVQANSDQTKEFTQGQVQVSNASPESLPLSALELRYYLESEYGPEETRALLVRVDHAEKSGRVYTNLQGQHVLASVALVEAARPGADAFIAIGFLPPSGLLLPGETVLVKFRVEPPDPDYYRVPRDQTNDYSFGACAKFAALWPRMLLLRGGELLSGEPPEGLVLPSGDAHAGAGGGGASEGEAGASQGGAFSSDVLAGAGGAGAASESPF